MKFYKSLYIHSHFFAYISGVAALFLISYWFQIFYNLAWVATLILVVFGLFDLFLLFNTKKGIYSKRILPDKFSNSDENPVAVFLENNYSIPVFLSVIDELPIQFQKRDFEYTTELKASESETFQYTIIPFERGEYFFGNINVYASSSLKIFSLGNAGSTLARLGLWRVVIFNVLVLKDDFSIGYLVDLARAQVSHIWRSLSVIRRCLGIPVTSPSSRALSRARI